MELERLCAEHCEVRKDVQASLEKIANLLGEGASAASDASTHERETIKKRTSNFDHRASAPYQFFAQQKWNTLTLPEQVAIGEVIAHEAQVTMDREAKRRKAVMFKWMADNWDRLYPWALRIEIKTTPSG
jgi:Flp pilus assembly protein TadG